MPSSITLANNSTIPSPPAIGKTNLFIDSNSNLNIQDASGSILLNSNYQAYNGGRLTLASGSPAPNTDVSSASILYYTPYKNNLITLVSGSNLVTYTFVETPITLTTSASTGSKPYDIFGYVSSGSLTLGTKIWTNGSVRLNSLSYQNGMLVLSGSSNYRYLGTIYMDSGSRCDDSSTQRFVWNYYNRVDRYMTCQEATSHTYNGADRLWNNSSTNNLLQCVIGVVEDIFTVSLNPTLRAGADGSYAITYSAMGNMSLAFVGNYNLQLINAGATTTGHAFLGYNASQVYELGNSASSTFSSVRLWVNGLM